MALVIHNYPSLHTFPTHLISAFGLCYTRYVNNPVLLRTDMYMGTQTHHTMGGEGGQTVCLSLVQFINDMLKKSMFYILIYNRCLR